MQIPSVGATQECVVIEFKYGPDKNGPQHCLCCRRPFVVDDFRQMSWDPQHVYAVGIHTICIAVSESDRGETEDI